MGIPIVVTRTGVFVQRCFTVVELTYWIVQQWSLRTDGLRVQDVVFVIPAHSTCYTVCT